MIFVAASLISISELYSVVVLPEPVGPVTSTIPCGRRISLLKVSYVSSDMPKLFRLNTIAPLSKILMTKLSP